MSPTQVFKIARREYLSRVRSRAFIITTVMVPLFMAGYTLVLPMLFASGIAEMRLAVVDAGTGLGPSLAGRLGAIERPRVEVTEQALVPDGSAASRAPYTEAVRDQTIDGYLLLVEDAELVARARYYARETGNPGLLRELEIAVESTVLDRLLDGSSVDADRVRALQRSGLRTVTVSAEGTAAGGFETALASTLVLAMLLYTSVLINGQGMALAIVEEKSSRLIEVILGAVTATEFMTGKILGVLGSGLTQLAVWVAFSLLGLLYAWPSLALGGDLGGFDLGGFLSLERIAYFSIFFGLGYFLYSILFAAVAATCTGTEELGHAMFVAMMPMIMALLSTFYVIANPGTPTTRVLSLLPPFTPLVMLARVNVLRPPAWEIWLGIILLALGILATGWLSAKVFRYALLLTGKRPTLPELIGVMRAS